MTIKEAKTRLAKAGMGLETVKRRATDSHSQTIYPVITPIGNVMEFRGNELAQLLRDLEGASRSGAKRCQQ